MRHSNTAVMFMVIVAVTAAFVFTGGANEFGVKTVEPKTDTPDRTLGTIDTERQDQTPTVGNQGVETGTISLDGLTVSPEFRIRSNKADWEFPTRIEFQHFQEGNWTDSYARLVREDEAFTPELAVGVRYRIVVKDAEGDRRFLAGYTPQQGDESYTLMIGRCCVDDFSTEVPSDG